MHSVVYFFYLIWSFFTNTNNLCFNVLRVNKEKDFLRTFFLIRRKSDYVLPKSYGIQNRKCKDWEGQCSLFVTEGPKYLNRFASCSHEVLQRHAVSVLLCSHTLLQTHANSTTLLERNGGDPNIKSSSSFEKQGKRGGPPVVIQLTLQKLKSVSQHQWPDSQWGKKVDKASWTEKIERQNQTVNDYIAIMIFC